MYEPGGQILEEMRHKKLRDLNIICRIGLLTPLPEQSSPTQLNTVKLVARVKTRRECVTKPSGVHPWKKVKVQLWLCATNGPQINAPGSAEKK